MIKDNRDHPGLIVRLPDEGAALVGDIQEAVAMLKLFGADDDFVIRSVECYYNWNRGQPYVLLGNMKLTLMDLEPDPEHRCQNTTAVHVEYVS